MPVKLPASTRPKHICPHNSDDFCISSEQTKGGSERFFNAMVSLITESEASVTDEERRKANEEIINELLGSPTSLEQSGLRRDQQAFRTIFKGMSEIFETRDVLEQAAIYLERSGPQRRGISRSRNFAYHVTHWLNEVYILQERMVAFCNQICKLYRSSPHAGFVKDYCDCLKDAARDHLKQIVSKRGSHVHQERIGHPTLQRLRLSELFINPITITEFSERARKFYARAHRLAYRDARKYWLSEIKTQNEKITALLEVFFDKIHSIVFSKQTQTKETG